MTKLAKNFGTAVKQLPPKASAPISKSWDSDMVKSLHVMNQALRHAPGHQSLLRDAYSMHSLQYVEQTVRAFSDQLSNDPGSAWSILHPLLSPPAIRPRVAGNTPHERIAAFHAHFSSLFAPPPPAPPLPAVQFRER